MKHCTSETMKLLILTTLLLTPLTEMHAAPVTVKPNMAQVTLDNTQPTVFYRLIYP